MRLVQIHRTVGFLEIEFILTAVRSWKSRIDVAVVVSFHQRLHRGHLNTRNHPSDIQVSANAGREDVVHIELGVPKERHSDVDEIDDELARLPAADVASDPVMMSIRIRRRLGAWAHRIRASEGTRSPSSATSRVFVAPHMGGTLPPARRSVKDIWNDEGILAFMEP